MLNRLVNPAGMSSRVLTVVLIAAVAVIATTNGTTAKEANPVVVMETSKGTIVIELYPEKAPVSVENFLWYVDNEFYDGLVFHRVMENFMIQGGGMTKDLVRKEGRAPIKNEAKNGLKNDRGTLAMARTNDINSATSQFFVNLKNNDFLNYVNDQQYGYAVFGKVISGMEVVDEIALAKVADKGGQQNVPTTPIVITSAARGEAPKKEAKKESGKKAEESSTKE